MAVSTQDVTVQLAFLFLYYVGYSSPARLYAVFIYHTFYPADVLHPSLAPHFKTFQLSLI
jgi:hypothetical protein